MATAGWPGRAISRIAPATQVSGARMRHGQGVRRRDGRIDRVAARFQHAHSGSAGLRLHRDDHAVAALCDVLPPGLQRRQRGARFRACVRGVRRREPAAASAAAGGRSGALSSAARALLGAAPSPLQPNGRQSNSSQQRASRGAGGLGLTFAPGRA